MKRIFAILIAMVGLCGCLNEKDYAENAIVPSLIVGTWYESYEIYPDFETDSSSTYTFNEDGTCLIEVYHADADGASYTYNYTTALLFRCLLKPSMTTEQCDSGAFNFTHINRNLCVIIDIFLASIYSKSI